MRSGVIPSIFESFPFYLKEKKPKKKPPKVRFSHVEETAMEIELENAVSEIDSLKRKLSDAEAQVKSLKKKIIWKMQV